MILKILFPILKFFTLPLFFNLSNLGEGAQAPCDPPPPLDSDTDIQVDLLYYRIRHVAGNIACGTCPFALVSLQVVKNFRFAFSTISFSRPILSLRDPERH